MFRLQGQSDGVKLITHRAEADGRHGSRCGLTTDAVELLCMEYTRGGTTEHTEAHEKRCLARAGWLSGVSLARAE